MEVDDLFVDLADGKKLLKLLEIISGEKLGKPNNGRMRVHKVENINKSLAFLHTKVLLKNVLVHISVILSYIIVSTFKSIILLKNCKRKLPINNHYAQIGEIRKHRC